MLLDKAFKRRKGFGIIEVLVSITVLGFLYLALMNLQLGNRQSLLRIRGRDAAVEVAQQVLDSLQSIGAASIVSDSVSDITFKGMDYRRKWARSNIPGDSMSIVYSTELTVKPDTTYHSKDTTKFATVEHVYAKNVSVKVSWPFKGSIQSISISGVIR